MTQRTFFTVSGTWKSGNEFGGDVEYPTLEEAEARVEWFRQSYVGQNINSVRSLRITRHAVRATLEREIPFQLAGAQTISRALHFIQTLRSAADQHKADCSRSDCNVSLTVLREIAALHVANVRPSELAEAQKLTSFEEWPH